MVDANQSWSLPKAKETLTVLEELDPFFAEEPLRADADPAQWEELANSTSTPLAGGANIYGVDVFIRMADAGVQVLQPDVAKWGGMTGALDLAAAAPSGMKIWPHFMGTAVGQTAAIGLTAALGESSVCEMDMNVNRLRADLCGDA